jgi:hypothetical protein
MEPSSGRFEDERGCRLLAFFIHQAVQYGAVSGDETVELA